MSDHTMHTENATAAEKTHKPLMSKQVLLICVAVATVAITAITVFKVSVGSLFFIAALVACPLMHILMMKGMHKHE